MKSRSAQTAAAIRTELKSAFPGIKFRVTSDTSSVNIEYFDGVKRERVERVVCKYEMGRFDSMSDIYEYTNSRSDIPQVKYVFVRREMSDKTRDAIGSEFGFKPGTLDVWDENARSYRSEIVYRQFQTMQFGEHADVKNETELNAEREINGGLTNAEMYAPKTEIVVIDESTLALIHPTTPEHATVIKSDKHATGSLIAIEKTNEFRTASKYDFDQYDVDFTPYNDRLKFIFDDMEIPVMGSFKENDEIGDVDDADEIDALVDLLGSIGRGNARIIDVNELNQDLIGDIDPDDDGDLPTGLIGGNDETPADMTKYLTLWVNPKFRK
jgi:hypothetical protein